ncbi:hypothetical protein AOLI_G00235440 [Acnodon oligacanthus]
MSLTISLLFLLFMSGLVAPQWWAVNYNPKYICALKGSTVTIECTYTYPRDLQVEVPERVIEGGDVTLTCKTTCRLTVRPTFTWYRNGRRLSSSTDQLRLQPVSGEDAGRYHCAVLGQNLRSPEVPLNVRLGTQAAPVLQLSSLQNVDPNAKDDTYTALDPVSRSSDDVYSTLANPVLFRPQGIFPSVKANVAAKLRPTLQNVQSYQPETKSELQAEEMMVLN